MLHSSDFVEGTCMDMCPKSERDLRERERLLHFLETKTGSTSGRGVPRSQADPLRAVKEYTRSAAGHAVPKPSELRPLPVLIKTTNYLLSLAVVERVRSAEWNCIYDFVSDRMRAVRKDLVIQGLHGEGVLPVLEPMVFFHIYASYRLCESKPAVFDRKLNNDLLMDCLRRILDIYDMGGESERRDAVEAVFALHSIHSQEGLLRLISLPPPFSLQESKVTAIAVETLFAYELGNYSRFFRLFQKLPAPLMCCVSQHFPNIRRRTWQTMCCAYSSKVLKVPAEHLAKLVLLPDGQSVLSELSHYEVSCVDGSHVRFEKNTLNPNAKLILPSRLPQLNVEEGMEKYILKQFLN